MPEKKLYREVVVHFYHSLKEWLQREDTEEEGYVSVALFDLEVGEISLLSERGLKEMKRFRPDLFSELEITDLNISRTLAHEYLHYLQWRKGAALEVFDEDGDPVCLPLGLKKKSKSFMWRVHEGQYPREDWEIEAEAFYIEENSHLLDTLPIY